MLQYFSPFTGIPSTQTEMTKPYSILSAEESRHYKQVSLCFCSLPTPFLAPSCTIPFTLPMFSVTSISRPPCTVPSQCSFHHFHPLLPCVVSSFSFLPFPPCFHPPSNLFSHCPKAEDINLADSSGFIDIDCFVARNFHLPITLQKTYCNT